MVHLTGLLDRLISLLLIISYGVISKIVYTRTSIEVYLASNDQLSQLLQQSILICARKFVNQCSKDFKGVSMLMVISLNI